MKIIQTLLNSSNDQYSSFLQFYADGLNNTDSYLIDLSLETQNPNGGDGYPLDIQVPFNVAYPTLRVLNKPIVTELLDKSAMQINWANICTNPGTIAGTSNYVNDYIEYGNTVLNLSIGATLTYASTVIPSNSTFPFMIKLPLTYNGIIFTTTDGKYKIGYDLSKQMFYSIINGITNYSELIKITQNPFFITMLPSKVIIRQYNIYKNLINLKGMKLSDMTGYPLAFMCQANN